MHNSLHCSLPLQSILIFCELLSGPRAMALALARGLRATGAALTTEMSEMSTSENRMVWE